MSILKVARMGHPVLKQKAKVIPKSWFKTPELLRLIQDMHDTMDEYGGIGLAAPQVHESWQLAIIRFGGSHEKGLKYLTSKAPSRGSTIFINPKIKILNPKKQIFWEGCLSIPELRGQVARPCQIQVDFFNEKGNPQRLQASGFVATVIQHELDHLKGILYPQRMKDLSTLSFTDEWERFKNQEK